MALACSNDCDRAGLNLPVAMFTSNSSAMHRQRATTLGANAYIVKSEFDESLLVGTVAKLIGAQL